MWRQRFLQKFNIRYSGVGEKMELHLNFVKFKYRTKLIIFKEDSYENYCEYRFLHAFQT